MIRCVSMTATELKQIRARIGWSQQKLADTVGVARNSIARQERGEMKIRESLGRLIRILAKAERGEAYNPKRSRRRTSRTQTAKRSSHSRTSAAISELASGIGRFILHLSSSAG